MSASVEEVKLAHWPPRWLAIVAFFIGLGIIASLVFFGASAGNDTPGTKTLRALAANTECARQVSSNYADKQDAIFKSLLDRAAFAKAVQDFIDFEKGPNGKPESRAARTKRLCPSSIP